MPKVTITLRDLATVKAALERLASTTTNVKLSYAIAKNLAKMRTEINSLQLAAKPSDEFTEYDKARHEAAIAHSGKDSEGKPLVVDGNYAIKDREGFDAEIKKLREKYAEAISAREGQLKEVEELLDKEIEHEFHVIDASLLNQTGVFKKDTEGLGLLLEPLLDRIVVLEE